MLIRDRPLAWFTSNWGWRNASSWRLRWRYVMALVVPSRIRARARGRHRASSPSARTMRQTLAGVVAASRQQGYSPIFFLAGAACQFGLCRRRRSLGGHGSARTYGLGWVARPHDHSCSPSAGSPACFLEPLDAGFKLSPPVPHRRCSASMARRARFRCRPARCPSISRHFGSPRHRDSSCSTARGKRRFPAPASRDGVSLLINAWRDDEAATKCSNS